MDTLFLGMESKRQVEGNSTIFLFFFLFVVDFVIH